MFPFSSVFAGIAVRALSTMKHNEDERSMSPQMNNNHTIFSGLHPATASAMGMLAPQFFQGNPAATAALMAAGLPMSLRATLATGLFPHHPALFGAWGPPPSSCSSPPKSPMSPAYGMKVDKKYTNNNNHIVSTTSDIMAKKASKRKPFAKKEINTVSVKKELLSPPSTDVSLNHDMMSPGLISPPNSGSSPNSTGSIDVPTTIVVASTTKDPSRDKVFTCKICNRSFGYKHVLQNHERTHTGEKPFECPECHKRFTRDHHLKTHMRLHTGEKPYSCSHCDRQFVQVANLRRHLRVHTGERPYTCEICKSRFSDSNQLKAHSIAHTGEKPFSCTRCPSRFRRKHHLDGHKCENAIVTSPLTPMMSPNMYMSDVKSEFSEDSLDLSKISSISKAHFGQSMRYHPEENHDIIERRNRKSTEVRHVVRIPQIMHLPTMLPEQTEPEDLSMHSPRSSQRSPITSPVSMQELEEELDDAASLYIKQRMHQNHGMES